MPPRLMHKKSRNGCKRCKARKVKCDEQRPICGACKRHNLECIYLEPGPPAPRRDPPSAASVLGQLSPGQSSDSATVPVLTPPSGGLSLPDHDDGSIPTTEERRILELRLMHRYMQSFSDIFAGVHNSTVAEVWRDLVPSMAIYHPFLLHALYTVTTCHAIITQSHATQDASRAANGQALPGSVIPTLIPSAPPVSTDLDIEEMKRARQLYFNLAIRGQRLAVSRLCPENADAVCMATILISNQGFLLDHDLDFDKSGYAPPIQWMMLAASITTVIRACHGMLGPDAAVERIAASGRSLLLNKYSQHENGLFFKPILDFQADAEPADREAYQDAIYFLGAIHNGIDIGESVPHLSRRFLSFASLIPPHYIALVRQHRPRALVILACFFAMTKEVEGIWWFRGAAERHVYGIKTLVPPEWAWGLDWAEDVASATTSARRRPLLHRATMCSSISS